MKKLIALLICVIFSIPSFAQEFMARVTVDYSQVQGSNVSVFQTLKDL